MSGGGAGGEGAGRAAGEPARPDPFTEAERALMAEAARRVVEQRMAVPAMMMLETLAPMNFVTASMLHAVTPVLGLALGAGRLERLARLLERRESIPELVRAIDEAEEARRRAGRAARGGAAGKGPSRG